MASNLCLKAKHALRAVDLEHSCGPRTARAYAAAHGVFRLYILARLLRRNSI